MGSNLRGARFFKADLESADFEGADMTGASMEQSYLVGANFKNTGEWATPATLNARFAHASTWGAIKYNNHLEWLCKTYLPCHSPHSLGVRLLHGLDAGHGSQHRKRRLYRRRDARHDAARLVQTRRRQVSASEQNN